MLDELEARRRDKAPPGLQRQIGAVAHAVLLLDVGTAGIAGKQYAARYQRSAEVLEYPTEFLCRYVK